MTLQLAKAALATVLAIGTTAGLAGCTTQQLPEAANIAVTKNAADVQGCQLLGKAIVEPPFRTRNDATNRLMNEVALMGGNTLFILQQSFGPAEGAAYKCYR